MTSTSKANHAFTLHNFLSVVMCACVHLQEPVKVAFYSLAVLNVQGMRLVSMQLIHCCTHEDDILLSFLVSRIEAKQGNEDSGKQNTSLIASEQTLWSRMLHSQNQDQIATCSWCNFLTSWLVLCVDFYYLVCSSNPLLATFSRSANMPSLVSVPVNLQ